MKLNKIKKACVAGVSLLAVIACTSVSEPATHEAAAEKLTPVEQIRKSINTAKSTSGDGNPAIWKLADEDTNVYIFGTVHILPKAVDWMTPEFESAFASADTLYLEVDTDSPEAQAEMQKLIAEQGMMGGGQTLSSLFDEAELQTVSTAAGSVGLPMSALEQFKPWFVGLQLQVMQMMKNGYDIESGVESVLVGQAEEAGMAFGYLESPAQQVGFLASGSLEEQADNLVFAAEILDLGQETIDVLVEEWADGDVAGLGAIIGDPEIFGSQEIYDSLIVKRNQNWVPQIAAMLDEPGTKFVAVGAGHLAGPDSVIGMLKAAGHKVEVYQ